MSTTEAESPTITIAVDPRNPGQFFACCGLLELAHRIWGTQAVGWFNNLTFGVKVGNLRASEVSDTVLQLIRNMRFEAIAGEKEAGSPLLVDMGNHGKLLLDWWLKTVFEHSLRTWGRGYSLTIFQRLRGAAVKAKDVKTGFELATDLKGVLSVDPRPAWTTIDAGFSPNDQGFTVTTFPLVELLAGFGLQRVRPYEQGLLWKYDTWATPLPCPLVAVARQMLPRNKTDSYQFTMEARGQMARYFTYATKGDS